jgi:hypothetical protein
MVRGMRGRASVLGIASVFVFKRQGKVDWAMLGNPDNFL